MLPLQATVNLKAMAMKGYSTIPKAPALLEPHHMFSVIIRTHVGGRGLTPQQKSSWCILQTQLTGQFMVQTN